MKALLRFHKVSATRGGTVVGGATLHGITMYDWGLDDETGLLTETAERNVMCDEKWIKDSTGTVVAGSIYNLRAEFNFSGYIKGATLTGLPSYAPGASMTIAFPEVGTALAPIQGVGAGLILCRTNNIKKATEDFVHADTTGYQFPSITA